MGYYDSIYGEELPHRAITVYMYLKERADKNNQCFPAMSTIAEDLKVSRRTVQRAVNDLIKAGYVLSEQRWRPKGGKSSLIYTILK
ncbi:helix-turn-helix domain-containing protein [[Clostridium] symbiosum]|uniref:helix-turn-helix domain-containing protein n=1 Tax=Clostridium symbiosum TaxID=1512 RepID=UPI001570AEA2|nr:helix-turn-helix domain-containing protein [[Clostridium] symbiosum]NSF81618.1 helix-turn-helix domain-containing protein [[Clostridium] symbiosum]NSI98270.1 helix-turn-helix domain-containing protein [[Clostridium] symbiosum]